MTSGLRAELDALNAFSPTGLGTFVLLGRIRHLLQSGPKALVGNDFEFPCFFLVKSQIVCLRVRDCAFGGYLPFGGRCMHESPGTRASLLVRVRDPGDAAAWNQFVDLYAPLIYGFFRRQKMQDADAADLTQEVLVRVSHGIRWLDYDPARGTFRGWLFTLVRNRWRTWAGRPQLPREEANLDEQPAPGEDQTWESDYRRRLFDWAADEVRPNYSESTWQAFWRTSVEGKIAADVARELCISVAAVYMAKSRVLARIKEVLRDADDLGWDW